MCEELPWQKLQPCAFYWHRQVKILIASRSGTDTCSLNKNRNRETPMLQFPPIEQYDHWNTICPMSYALIVFVLQFLGLGVFATAIDYACTGNVQSYTVPTGVNQLQVELVGAAGGSYTSGATTVLGGAGGCVSAVISVSAIQVLYISVGCQGTASENNAFGGGGKGRKQSDNNYSGGGGGASDVRTSQSDLSSRLVVAGGGGGASWHMTGGAGSSYHS